MVAVPAGFRFGPGLIQRRRIIHLTSASRSAVRSPALQRAHFFMWSLIRDLAINVLSGVIVGVSGLAIRRLSQRRTGRGSNSTATADTSGDE